MRFGTDGVRGLANAELTPSYVLDLGRAAGRVLGSERVVVARDTRHSGPMLEAALSAGFAAEGVDVEIAGVLPTPAIAALAAEHGVAAAMITASHNPFPDNGVKLFARGGYKLTDDAEQQISAVLGGLGSPSRVGSRVGTIRRIPRSGVHYLDRLTGLFPAGALSGRRIVLDTANGAMSAVAPEGLRRLGADVVVINAEPDGTNINAACGATDPRPLAAAVLAESAELGLAFDGDGDRVIAVDHTGRIVDGDQIIALLALDLRAQGRLAADTVVVTVMSNLGFHRAMAEAGIGVITTAVGDRYVLEALESDKLSLGGEQSGHLILRELATTGDGLLAGLLLADLVRRAGTPLADLAGQAMVVYPQVLRNVRVAQRITDIAERIAPEIAAVEAELGSDGRVLVRASGTEPLVRVMVEARDESTAHAAAQRLVAAAEIACH